MNPRTLAPLVAAALALGACAVDPGPGADSDRADDIQNGTVWNPWTNASNTWSRNVVRLTQSGGCTGTLIAAKLRMYDGAVLQGPFRTLRHAQSLPVLHGG